MPGINYAALRARITKEEVLELLDKMATQHPRACLVLHSLQAPGALECGSPVALPRYEARRHVNCAAVGIEARFAGDGGLRLKKK